MRHITDDIARAEHLGTMSMNEARKLVAAAEQAVTLSEEHKQIIRERLLGEG